ncbi:MAG: putative DNA-binding domain-containing protein [Rhodobacteraceae bacterium]|nr:putative DNA-binding domain-containing protein [Paracoccaceae bacterium]
MTGQSDFAAALLDPDRSTPAGLCGPGGAPAGARFDVYRNNVAVSLTEALETGFPTIRALVGDPFFKAMAGVHLRGFPPQSPMMMDYGQDFPAFLESFDPVAHLPYLADVARLELALRRAYHAADAIALDPAALAALPPDRLTRARLILAPAVQVLRSPYPVHAIWTAHRDPNAPKPTGGGQTVAVSRPVYDPMADPISPAQGEFLQQLGSGARLGTALDHAAQDPEFSFSTTLSLMLARGMIVSVEESPAP